VIKIALITEGDLEDVTHVDTKNEADAFCDGFGWGGSCYGAGFCTAVAEYDLKGEFSAPRYRGLLAEIKEAFMLYNPEAE
jgi:hypothetical protein